MADVTYDQLMDEAQKEINETEQEIARLRRARLVNLVDSLPGVLNDSATMSRAAEVDEALREQIKAAEKYQESLESFRDGLRHDHGGMNEAHQDAPVKGADPDFYEG